MRSGVAPPDIPENVTLYTQLPGDARDALQDLPELFVVYEDENGKNIFGGMLSAPASLYRESYDAMILRLAVEDMYDEVKMPGIYRFHRKLQSWARTLR